MANDRIECRRDADVGSGETQLGRLLFENGIHRLNRRVAFECAAAGEHLVEDAAERKDVAAMVDRLAAHLLGRHVAGRADHSSGRCPLLLRPGLGVLLIFFRSQLREAEVENLYAAIFRDEDVFGLEVAMHDALLVRGCQTVRDLNRVFDRFANRKAALDSIAQCPAVEELHHEIGRTVVRAHVEDRDQVRMIDRTGRADFLLEAPQPVAIEGECRGKDLDRDFAADARVARAPNLPHPARPDGRDDLVGSEAFADDGAIIRSAV